MKMVGLKWLTLFSLCILCTLNCFSQKTVEVVHALAKIKSSVPPCRDPKWTLRPVGEYFPCDVPNIPDELYSDFQGTKVIFHAYTQSDLMPSLHWKFTLPNTDFQLGVLCFGGATDCQVDRMFVADKFGRIKDCLTITYGVSDVLALQYELTTDYKIITYRLVPTSSRTIMYNEILGRDKSSKTVECYRLDTTYRINSNGRFEKESELKHPVKAYTVKEMYEKNVWEL